MQKIMFNDRYGLTRAVLSGRKTMTRRIEIKDDAEYIARHWNPMYRPKHCYYRDARGLCQLINCRTDKIFIPKYQLGEIVAVAQSYYDALGMFPSSELNENGTFNKMFVRAALMPNHIWITDIHVERLQDISDEDCLREGIRYIPEINKYYFERDDRDEGFYFNNPHEAFASLIDKVSGRGTWESNPYVVAYKFELIK